MWQDYVLGAAQWVFFIALIPALLHPDEKPPFISSLLTGVLLATLACTYLSLGLKFGSFPAFLQSLQWLALAFQRYRINTKKGIPVVEMPSWLRRS